MNQLLVKAAIALGLWSAEPDTPTRPGTPRPTQKAQEAKKSESAKSPSANAGKLPRTYSFSMDRTQMSASRTPFGAYTATYEDEEEL